MIPLYIFLALVVITLVWAISSYNGFVRLAAQADEAFSDITVQMKRRFDLIPNLIETVKGAANFESSTLEKVIQARNTAMSAMSGGNLTDIKNSDQALSGALKTVFALSESYPDLKASTNYLELQRELSDTEDKIQAARRFYNANVRDFNIGVGQFPGNVIAGAFHFTTKELFDVDEADRAKVAEPVAVKF